MRKFNVLAQAFHPTTGVPLANARVEQVDVDENEIFRGCKTLLEVKRRYELFWNGCTPQAPRSTATEIVFVQSITPLQQPD